MVQVQVQVQVQVFAVGGRAVEGRGQGVVGSDRGKLLSWWWRFRWQWQTGSRYTTLGSHQSGLGVPPQANSELLFKSETK